MCAALLVPPGAAFAQPEQYDGLPIREIAIDGLETLTQDTVEHYLLGPDRGQGRRLDLSDLDRRIKELWKRELIDGIQVAAERQGDGVRLVIELQERPVLVSVEYVGIKRVGRTEILEAADKERVSVYENQPLQRGELLRLKQVIEDLYKEQGYRFAQVAYTLEEAGLGQRRVTFTIDEGDKVKIGDIEFDGNTVFGDWRLRWEMKNTKQASLITRVSKKDIY
ncbi:MAG: POTRA domain-containing protein, partial [Acidobacteriota bacterium]